jgi:hypothetical protein
MNEQGLNGKGLPAGRQGSLRHESERGGVYKPQGFRKFCGYKILFNSLSRT